MPTRTAQVVAQLESYKYAGTIAGAIVVNVSWQSVYPADEGKTGKVNFTVVAKVVIEDGALLNDDLRETIAAHLVTELTAKLGRSIRARDILVLGV